MHLAICTIGTVLAMIGHFPHRSRLWVPHTVGLAVMLLVSFGVGDSIIRWGGITLLVVLALGSITNFSSAREAVEAGVDAAAMSVLTAVVPAMPGMGAMAVHLDRASPDTALAVVTLGAWASGRVLARLRLPDTGAVADAGLWKVNLTGSTVMLAGMAMMIV